MICYLDYLVIHQCGFIPTNSPVQQQNWSSDTHGGSEAELVHACLLTMQANLCASVSSA